MDEIGDAAVSRIPLTSSNLRRLLGEDELTALNTMPYDAARAHLRRSLQASGAGSGAGSGSDDLPASCFSVVKNNFDVVVGQVIGTCLDFMPESDLIGAATVTFEISDEIAINPHFTSYDV